MKNIIEKLSQVKIVPVVVLNDADKAVPLAKTLVNNGCTCIEVTFRTKAAAEAISRINKEVPEMLIGAGTLLTKEEVISAQEAGATFGVSPGFDPEIIDTAKNCGLLFVPGVSTASEICQALAKGCIFQKFFPAEVAGGTPMLKALLGAFRHTGIRFMPTGGINAKNIEQWLEIPEVIACGSSWICDGKLIANGDWDEIGARTAEAIKKLA